MVKFSNPVSMFLVDADFTRAKNLSEISNLNELAFPPQEKQVIIAQERAFHPVVMIGVCNQNIVTMINELNELKRELFMKLDLIKED